MVTYTIGRLTIARNIWILSCIKEHKVLTWAFSYFTDNSNVYGGLWLKICLSIVLNNSSACNPIYLLSEICRSEYHPYICWVRLSEYRPYIWRAILIAAGLQSVSACQVENFRPINACTTLKSNSLILWKLPLFWTWWVLWWVFWVLTQSDFDFKPVENTSPPPPHIKVGGGEEKGHYLWVSRNVQTCFDGRDVHPFYMYKAIWEIFECIWRAPISMSIYLSSKRAKIEWIFMATP